MKKSNPKCQNYGGNKTVKKGSQNGCKRFWCKDCKRSFSVDHRRKELPFWISHVDGIPLRKLADERNLSPARVYQNIKKEMDDLPDSNWLTVNYCNRFCGILVMDGKYVKVKGYKQKIPFIYGIDYLTHDIVIGLLAPSENEEAFLKVLSSFEDF
ncbi:MAG: hypothetical protein ACD_72C00535G0001 [uncultured bacterium]|nr:MAG: hypothetical protein ACD_72C00535G0001 [uncultured bacterium]